MQDSENMREDSKSKLAPLRILIVAGAYPKISETFITSHAIELARRGHTVTVLSRGRIDCEFAKQLHGTLQITLVETQNDHDAKRWKRFIKRYIRAVLMPRATLKAFKTGSALERLFLSNQFTYSILRSLTKENGPFDICHTHFGVHGIWVEELRKKFLFSRAHIVTFHGFDAWTVSDEIYSRYRWLGQQLVWFTANSLCTSERMIEIGIPNGRIDLWRMGVDLDSAISLASRSAQQSEVSNRVQIFCCGRLTPVKGHGDLITAIGLAQKRADVKLILRIAGGGSEQDYTRLQAVADAAEVLNDIELLGPISHQDVWREMQDADIFALTSKTAENGAKEGLGIVFLEASASGLPILATRSGGIPDAVLDGVTGLLAEEGNPEDIAIKLLQLIDLREKWEEMGRAGRAHIEASFSYEAAYQQLIKTYTTSLHSIENRSDK